MTECRCGGELECIGTRDSLPRKYYQCKDCGSTYPEDLRQLCDCCGKAILTEYEKQVVLNKYYCHSCLIKKYILQNVELKKYKNNPNKKYNDLKKRTTSMLEFIKGSAESIIDECVEITEERNADFNRCREMDMPLHHAGITINNKKVDDE